MTANVASSRKIFTLLAGLMSTLTAYESIIPLDLREIFLTVKIAFEVIRELYQVLTIENIHKILVFVDFKDMKLSTDLYKIISGTFEFEIFNPDDGQVYQITEGRFDSFYAQ